MNTRTLAPDLDGHVAVHMTPDDVAVAGLHQLVPDCPCDPEVIEGMSIGDFIYRHKKYDVEPRQEHDRALDERRDVMVTL